MKNNKISVTSNNIFPIIKRFLYSDQDIFLRELVSNATDAIIKLKTISKIENLDNIIDDQLFIKIILDKEKRKIIITDNGIGMNKEEIKKYINQIAFSGAEEFIKKYKKNTSSIIGHFGLGFYSSFMVSSKVTILTQSYKKNSKSIFWSCEGTPTFVMNDVDKVDRGTKITLYINKDNSEFLEYNRVLKLLQKYCKFVPVPIFFGLKNESNINKKSINNTHPSWTKSPTILKEKDYINFHKELYPHQLDDPLFWIHLNIDHPFNLTGILFFPKIGNKIDLQKDKIHLYQNQIYITDNLEGIVPDFLGLLRGVIDSPDIPLNVSRSHLQSDKSVKNISKYITRKVSDKLYSIFNNNRDDFNKKWNDIKIIVEYGMISNDKFFDKSINFFLFYTTDNEYFILKELKEKIEVNQRNKDGKIVILYSSNKESQYSSIKESSDKGYKVLLLDSPLSIHIIQKLEFFDKNISFVRVDSDHIDKLIISKVQKNQLIIVSEEEKKILKNYIINNTFVKSYNLSVKLENLSHKDNPFIIVIPEFSRRMEDINYSFGKNLFNNGEENKYKLIVNVNHIIIIKILKETSKEKINNMIKNGVNLALLSKNLLYGKNLDIFVSEKIKELC